MKYIFTDFYSDFSCVGGECPDSCCIGWDILVDEDTCKKYAALEEPLKSKICQNIEETEQDGKKLYRMRMEQDGRCPFLNRHNLCNIYIDVSPDDMCSVCRTYPRKIVSYYDVVMATVSVSCPEVARMLLHKSTSIFFGFAEDSTLVATDGADWDLYNELINGLVLVTDIMQDRKYPFWQRLFLTMQVTRQMQQYVEKREFTALRTQMESYKLAEYRKQSMLDMTENEDRDKVEWSFIYPLLEEIDRITAVLPERKIPVEAYKLIAKEDEGKYVKWNLSYGNITDETEYENLAVNFIFEYFMDALNGKNLFENIVKMVLLLITIKTYAMLEYNRQGDLKECEKIMLISGISRLMEHTHLLDIIAERLIKNNEAETLYKMAEFMRGAD